MKKNYLLLAVTSILFCFSFGTSYSQEPPCFQDYNSLSYKYNHLIQVPNLTTDMNLDILIGNLAMDSIRKSINEYDVISFLANQTYNDTLRMIMKYLYKMVDYNPILFKLTTSHWYDKNSILLNDLIEHIENQVFAVSPYPYLDKLLLKSSVIAHIYVEDTLQLIDSGSLYPTVSIVTGSILDTIKGNVLPVAKVFSNNQNKVMEQDNKLLNLPSNYLQFEYRLEWKRKLNNDFDSDIEVNYIDDDGNPLKIGKMMDSTGSGWVKKGKEYLVFLDFHLICKDTNFSYLTLFPFIMNSATCNVYPIENGFVIDHMNELGFGSLVEINLFKNLLKQRINQIINYSN